MAERRENRKRGSGADIIPLAKNVEPPQFPMCEKVCANNASGNSALDAEKILFPSMQASATRAIEHARTPRRFMEGICISQKIEKFYVKRAFENFPEKDWASIKITSGADFIRSANRVAQHQFLTLEKGYAKSVQEKPRMRSANA